MYFLSYLPQALLSSNLKISSNVLTNVVDLEFQTLQTSVSLITDGSSLYLGHFSFRMFCLSKVSSDGLMGQHCLEALYRVGTFVITLFPVFFHIFFIHLCRLPVNFRRHQSYQLRGIYLNESNGILKSVKSSILLLVRKSCVTRGTPPTKILSRSWFDLLSVSSSRYHYREYH